MNTKVEEALGVIASGVANRDVRIAWPGQSIAELDNAGKTLARYIAKQDATIARMFTREQVAELLRGMVPAAYTATDYLKGYVDDAEATGHNDFRTETLARIEAWQNQEQVK